MRYFLASARSAMKWHVLLMSLLFSCLDYGSNASKYDTRTSFPLDMYMHMHSPLPRNYAMEPPVHGMTAVRSGALPGPRQHWIELVLTTSDF